MNKNGKTRAETLDKYRVKIVMPPVLAAAHLLDYFWQVGPIAAGGMGAIPLSAAEIRAWQQGCGIVLQPWEFAALKRLSLDYLKEMQLSDDMRHPAPWDAAPDIGKMPQFLVGMAMKRTIDKMID